MFTRLNHIGIAVKNLDEASKKFSVVFNKDFSHAEIVEEQKVKVCFAETGNMRVELLEPIANDSPISKFLEKRGEGIHHLSYEVDDIEKELQRLKESGIQLIDEKPKVGAEGFLVAFLHPNSTNGVLIEISQKMKSS
ncbi:MAG: methylmalonyl-CoA epimerase [Ignavibacteria bacterium]|nr:methylmalonyl-CoA epimerase [Ignavibacteria bacterium]